MTLETAKRIVREQGEQANKEALAVVKGGMIYIERTKDGRRRAPWIEVLPTKTDEESSIDIAIENYRKGKHAQPRKIKQAPVQQAASVPQKPDTQSRDDKADAHTHERSRQASPLSNA